MRFHAVYRRLYFWLGSALVALMDAPPLSESAPQTSQTHMGCERINFVIKNIDKTV